MTFFRKFNIFTLLVVVASAAFALRLVNIITFKSQPMDKVGMVMPAAAAPQDTMAAQDNTAAKPPAVETVNEQPPPLTREDIRKAAQDTAKTLETATPDSAAPPSPAAAASAAAPPEEHAYSAAELDVLQSLSQRRDALDQREKTLTEKTALLQAAEKEVDRKVAELNKLKGEIEDLLGKQQNMEEERIASLVKIYEGMKPKEAATIFNTLDMGILLPVISRMNERKISPILAGMDPDKARLVTIQIALQRKLPAAQTADGKAPAPSPVPPAPSTP